MRLRHFAATLACSIVVLGALAPAAGADPARPTNYRSRILSISPKPAAISLRVVGGDGFLDLHVKRGHTVVVEGYEGEPWLRISPSGSVLENQLSRATYLNVGRYESGAGLTFPPGVGRDAAIADPRWATVASGGTYVWHDHRIHYMTPTIPPALVPGTNRVRLANADGTWVVKMTVDGTPVTVTGELLLLAAPSPALPWGLAVALALGVGAVALLRRRVALVLGAVVVGLGALGGAFAGWHELAVVPTQAGGNPVDVGLPIAAVVAAVLALLLRNAATRVIATLAGAAALLAWAVLRLDAFDKAVPLTNLDPTLARLLVAAALGAAIGGAVASVRSGALALAPLGGLDDEDDDEDVGAAVAPTHAS